MGFDDFDGVELFVLNVPQDLSLRRRNYSPVGTKSIDVDLRTRTRREEFLLGLKEFGCVEHASEWLEERMRGPVFMAAVTTWAACWSRGRRPRPCWR